MSSQTMRQWAGVLISAFLIIVVLTISYRNGNNHDESVATSFGNVHKLPLPDIMQCKVSPSPHSAQRSRQDSSEVVPDWLDQKLRLNTTQSRLFPFPKVFESEEQGLERRLALKSDFQIHLQYDGSMSVSTASSVDTILNRFCHSAVASAESKHAAASIAVTQIHVTFTNSNLLATTAAMRDILHQRSEVAKQNAQYIDDEMYTLNVSQDGVVYIMVHTSAATTSATHRGLANALATLNQLVNQVVPVRLPLSIIDWPDNHWRGLLLDVSRHFFPMALLKRCIQAMATSKFDTLHLHLTDSQSFPLLLDDTPALPLSQLALQGAFSPEKIYTKNDLRELVHFAESYGIEIIPEIDTPAHALSWGGAFKDLIVRCENVAGAAQTPHNIYPLDPSHPKVYEIIRAILTQVVDIFPSKYLHVGGDEVEERCWAESANLTHWARDHNLTVRGITGYFEQRVIDIVYDLHKIPIVWQGIIDFRSMPPIPQVRNNSAQSATNPHDALRALLETGVSGLHVNASSTGEGSGAGHSHAHVPTSAPTMAPALEAAAIVQPWKCWGGLALRAAMTALHSGHPMVMSACWYLDYNQDWTSYLATDLAASARAAVAQSSVHSGQPHFRHNGRRANAPQNSANGANHTTEEHHNNTLSEEVLSHLTAAQRMYLLLTDYAEEAPDTPVVSTNSPPSSSSAPVAPTAATAPTTALHSNYFIPGGEASMWTERVDCTNLECRLWPRAGAVGARLWGLGATFESVSYYNTGDSEEEHGAVRSGHSGGNRRHVQSRTGSQRTSTRHRTQPSTQTMKLDLPQTVQLYSAYVRFRHYLQDTLHMSPAALVFHYPLRCNEDSTSPETPQQTALCRAASKKKSANMIYPEDIDSEYLAYMRVHSQLHSGVELSSNSGHNNHIADGTFRITAQCMGIPEEVQRPLSTDKISAVQLNVGDGSTGTRGQNMLHWLQTQANRGVLFVGFCELNGWQDLESLTELGKNRPKIVFRAANAGFSFSHVMVNTQPYNLGIVSARPFTVLGEYGPPVFQRGVLHVYFVHIALHVFIVHLHAHSSSLRIVEAESLHKLTQPLLDAGVKVAIMGDFNTLSSHDKRQHDEAHLPEMLLRTDQPVFTRLRKKYMEEVNPQQIQYRPMEVLLGSGLHDACVEACQQALYSAHDKVIQHPTGNTTATLVLPPAGTGLPTWSLHSVDAFSVCMKTRCSATEPTKYNPEWPLQNDSHPYIRLDFILLSRSILKNVGESRNSPIKAGVDMSNVTEILSDHYPVYASWADATVGPIDLF